MHPHPQPSTQMTLAHLTQVSSVKNEIVVEMVDDDTALPEDEIVAEIRRVQPQGARAMGAGGELLERAT